uniref:Homing endonuclease LAGLIDADG domain-containing protein n=1 Tax=Dactylella tenuis TaxID=383872 RepID=A0A4Y5MZK9_9PEZI|nr:hypothetical protein [Dactylella tenuis]QCW06840.1 hypothetical protein [Dactylella tenuis]
MNNKNKLNPYYITGFTDAEGCFKINIRKPLALREINKKWSVEPIFAIDLHIRDLPLLIKIQDYFGAGYIHKTSDNKKATFIVSSTKDIIKYIIPHFDKYPLLTKKRGDYEIFKKIIELKSNKENLTNDNIQKIVNLKAALNLGLSQKLKDCFPNTIPAEKPIVEIPEYIDPNWIVGFSEGEGNFYVSISESKAYKTGSLVQLKFRIGQHERDTLLLNNLVKVLNIGKVEQNTESLVIFIVTKLNDVVEKIIPLFDKYPLQGIKAMDYNDFKEVAKLMEKKAHLTDSGLQQIIEIKNKMNKKRNYD